MRKKKATLEVVEWPIDRLKPYEGNPRDISDSAIDAVRKSIEAFGWRQPIVVTAEGEIIVGHTRYLAAQKLGIKRVPVHIAEGLSEAEIKAYRIADNRTGELTAWDGDKLCLELGDLERLNFDVSLTGWDGPDLLGLGAGIDVEAEWQGMPAYEHEDQQAYRSIRVHFKDQAAVDEFAAKVGCDLTNPTRFIWYPEIEIAQAADKRYQREP